MWYRVFNAAPLTLLALLVSTAAALPVVVSGQTLRTAGRPAASVRSNYAPADAARDREIAAHFSPAFHQGLGDNRRGDLITNFDFDGDWRGDNNWANADDRRHKLRAYVYYAVSETATHFFVHYAIFHPRDYKGGAGGALLSEAIKEGVKLGGRYDPTGLSREAVLAHENDMEGCLVVAAKGDGAGALGRARVVYVETLAHDRFLKYVAEEDGAEARVRVRVLDNHAQLYVEPKGHGIEAHTGERKQSPREGTIVYRFAGRAEDPEATEHGGAVGYELLPIQSTLWPRARKGANETYGAALDYGTLSLSVAGKSGRPATRKVTLGKLGAAFSGKVGAENVARPPWGWFDREEREHKQGAWFFDPAATVKRHFAPGDDFSVNYTYAPLAGVPRK